MATPETVVARIKRALPYVRPENVILAPDCGMKYLPRAVADAKLAAMVAAARLLRDEFGGRRNPRPRRVVDKLQLL